MGIGIFRRTHLLLSLLLVPALAFAQGDAKVGARIDATNITVGDQVHVFIEAQHNAKTSRLEWATLPDTFNHLEIQEKGKIDTVKNGDLVTYKQRLIITGFDSGAFKIPAFSFAVIPNGGTPYTMQTDSFLLNVQTVAVDTTQPFKGIKGIMMVKSSWRDYLLYIIIGIALILFIIWVTIYFMKNKKVAIPVDNSPKETLQEKTLRILGELEQQQLWQKGQVKEYYVQLTDVLREYIETRFKTHAMELTTDEILENARRNKEMMRHTEMLGRILYTADLAKFAKAQPTPQEHVDTMEYARQFVSNTTPVITENTTTTQS